MSKSAFDVWRNQDRLACLNPRFDVHEGGKKKTADVVSLFPAVPFAEVRDVIARELSEIASSCLILRVLFRKDYPGKAYLEVLRDETLKCVAPYDDGDADELEMYLRVLEHNINTGRRSMKHQAMRVFDDGHFELFDTGHPMIELGLKDKEQFINTAAEKLDKGSFVQRVFASMRKANADTD